jgi:hypothetical protein
MPTLRTRRVQQVKEEVSRGKSRKAETTSVSSAKTARGKSTVTLETSPPTIKKGAKQQTITEMIPMKVSKTRRGQAGLQTDTSSAKGMASSVLTD